MNIAALSQSFDNSLHGEIEVHLVHQPVVSNLINSIHNYRKALFSNDPEPDLTIPKLLNSLRFDFLMTPVSFISAGLSVNKRISELATMANYVHDPVEKDYLCEICDLASEICRWETHQNPLLVRAIDLYSGLDSEILTITRFRSLLTDTLSNQYAQLRWRVHRDVPLRQLRGTLNNLIVF